jgi:tetratricopeptide (TPR) repeat protein
VRRLKQIACALFFLLGLASPTLAQGPVNATADQEREYDAAFQEMLRRPADLDVLFKFATIATKTGDYEGAISALERMLLVNPDLPRVRLELAVLYYRLGSFEISRTYLETVLATANIPPEVRTRAEQYLAEVEKRNSRSRFVGEVFGGVRYQSNANLGPPTSSVRLFGQTANLNQAALGTADWGVVSSGYVRHIYDLGNQDRGQLETQLTGYANRQFQVSTANVSILDLTSGPRFQAFQGIFEDVSIKPMGLLGFIWVNDVPYYGSYGSAVEVGSLLSNKLRNTTYFSYRRLLYQDSWYLPANNVYTGNEYSANTTFQYALTDIVSIFANTNVQRFMADNFAQYSYLLGGVGGGMQFRFPDPLFKSQLPWTISLSANVQWWGYDQADPIIDPDVVRQQNDTILNISLAIPFDERTTLTISGGRFVRSANLPNYSFENNSFLMGVSWRF